MVMICQFCFTLAVGKGGTDRINHRKNTCALTEAVAAGLCYDCGNPMVLCECGCLTALTASLFALFKAGAIYTSQTIARAAYGVSDKKFDGVSWGYAGKELWVPPHLSGPGPFYVFRDHTICKVFAEGRSTPPTIDRKDLECLAFVLLGDALLAACGEAVVPQLGYSTITSPAPPTYEPVELPGGTESSEQQEFLCELLNKFMDANPGMQQFVSRNVIAKTNAAPAVNSMAGVTNVPSPATTTSSGPPPSLPPPGAPQLGVENVGHIPPPLHTPTINNNVVNGTVNGVSGPYGGQQGAVYSWENTPFNYYGWPQGYVDPYWQYNAYYGQAPQQPQGFQSFQAPPHPIVPPTAIPRPTPPPQLPVSSSTNPFGFPPSGTPPVASLPERGGVIPKQVPPPNSTKLNDIRKLVASGQIDQLTGDRLFLQVLSLESETATVPIPVVGMNSFNVYASVLNNNMPLCSNAHSVSSNVVGVQPSFVNGLPVGNDKRPGLGVDASTPLVSFDTKSCNCEELVALQWNLK
jgi:hypothetical protein